MKKNWNLLLGENEPFLFLMLIGVAYPDTTGSGSFCRILKIFPGSGSGSYPGLVKLFVTKYLGTVPTKLKIFSTFFNFGGQIFHVFQVKNQHKNI